jgi:REP element-mobilizing transposase RayT
MEIFSDDEDRMAYLYFVADETARFGVEILAWCLMANRVHLIVVFIICEHRIKMNNNSVQENGLI